MNTRAIVVLGLLLTFSLDASQAQGPSGADLVRRLGCQGCHALAGRGGNRGPAWDGLGTRLNPEAIRQQIVAPRGRMPNYAHLKPEELDAVVQYVSGLK